MLKNRWIHLSILITILTTSSFLNTYGIWFGLPSKERMELGFGGYEGLLKKKDLIEEMVKGGTWERSEFLDENSRGLLPELSPYFDILRTYHPDEQYIIKTISHMDPARLDLNPRTFIYAPFFFYQIAGGIVIGKAVNFITIKKDIIYYMIHPEEMAKIYIGGRLVVAIMGVGTVLLVYIIGKTLYGAKAGLAGSAIMTVIPIFVLLSHFIKPDVPMTFWATLSLLFCIYIYRTGNLKWYILSGIATGLSGGSKYPMLLSFLVVITAHFLRKTPRFRNIFYSFLFVGISFIITSPYIILDWQRFFHDVRCLGGLIAKDNLLYNIFDAGFVHLIVSFKYAVSPLISLMLLYGIIRTVIEKDKMKFLFLASMMPAVVCLLFRADRPTEYITSGLPMASILAARYWTAGRQGISNVYRKIGGFCMTCITVIGIIVGFCYTFSFVSVMAPNHDTRKDVSYWIDENIPEGSMIGMSQYPVIYRMPSINPQKFSIIYGGDLEKSSYINMDYYIVSPYERDFFTIHRKSFSYGPYAQELVSTGKFKIIKKFGGMPDMLGIRLSRDYQICGTFEVVCPTFLILGRVKE